MYIYRERDRQIDRYKGVYMYVCIYIYIYTYVCMYIYIYICYNGKPREEMKGDLQNKHKMARINKNNDLQNKHK